SIPPNRPTVACSRCSWPMSSLEQMTWSNFSRLMGATIDQRPSGVRNVSLGDNSMIGLEGISPQMLSDTIGAIYDCALDPDRWQDAVRRIVELSESQGCGVCVHDVKNFQNDRLFESGYDPEFSRLHAQNMAESPFVAAASLAKVGGIFRLLSPHICRTLTISDA